MKKYFEIEDGEKCYPLDYFIDSADPEQKEIILFEAKMEVGESHFYCSFHDFCGDVGEGCGKECKEYEPRNGKSGRCKFSKNCYTPVKRVRVNLDTKVIINLDDDEII